MWERLTATERNQDAFGLRLQHVEKTTDAIATDVGKLVDSISHRADPVSWKQIGLTVVSIGAVLSAVWTWASWSVANAPATRDLTERLAAIEQARQADSQRLSVVDSTRFTKRDALIQCLRSEIVNGVVCPHPDRGLPYPPVLAWRGTVKENRPTDGDQQGG